MDEQIISDETAKGETMGQKLTGLRFIVFLFTSCFVLAYIILCKLDSSLVQLQGLVLGIVGIAITLIGTRTVTDVMGKK